jgi:hypothetical protein
VTLRRLAVVPLVLLAGCGGAATEPPGVAEQVEADPELADRSRQLAGGIPRDRDDVRALVVRVVDSVEAMSTLDAEAYEAGFGRSPQDQAQLVGEWLADLDDAVRGRVAAVELREAAIAALGELDAPQTLQAQEVVRALALRLSATAPNEPTDNPKLEGAETLRATLQSAFSATK